jgi:hypothetical protein
MEDIELTSEQEEFFDYHKNCSYALGQIRGLERASQMLMKEASVHFTMEKDKQAELLRFMAKMINDIAKADEKEFEKQYPKYR